jgi:hypothetical protein
LTRNFSKNHLPGRRRCFEKPGPRIREKFLAPQRYFWYYDFLKYSKALLPVVEEGTLFFGENRRKERENDF